MFWQVGVFNNLRLVARRRRVGVPSDRHPPDSGGGEAVSHSGPAAGDAGVALPARPDSGDRRWSSASWYRGRREPPEQRLRSLPPRHGLRRARRRHHHHGDPRRIAGRLAERANRPHPGAREPDRRRHLDGRQQLPRPALRDRAGGRLGGGGGALAARAGDGGGVHPRRIAPARRLRRRAADGRRDLSARGRLLAWSRCWAPASSARPSSARPPGEARSRCWRSAPSQAARPTWSAASPRRSRADAGSRPDRDLHARRRAGSRTGRTRPRCRRA